MFMRQAATAALMLAALAACDVGVRSDETAAPPTGATSPADTATPGGTATGDCHVGTFQLTAITSKRGVSTAAGDLKVTSAAFVMTIGADGSWRLAADGRQPLTVQAGGISVQGTAQGEVRGRYARSGDKLGFQQEDASGDVTVQAGGSSHTVSMDDFAQALAPSGVTTVTCGATELRLSSETVELTLTRTGGSPGSQGGPAASGVLTITGKAVPVDEDCRGRKVVVESNGSPIRLRGDCPTVEVRGKFNPIEIDRVDEIILTGSGNTVTWASGLTRSEPTVQPGTANTIRRK